MATISAKDVMELRKATGLGMMECKKALTEADGDMDKAATIVREKYGAKMAGRSDRDSTEGKVAVAVSDDAGKGAIVQVNTETDFTANNDAFGVMATKVATLALEGGPGDVPKTDAMEAAIEEVRLVTQENIQFGQGRVLGGNGSDKKVGSYVHHTGKVGVLIELEGEASDELLKDLCMHVSAIVPEPVAIRPEDVPAEIVDKEKQIAKQQAIDSGKPAEIAEKMVTGKIRKFVDSIALLHQPFVKDDKKQIKDILPKGTTITKFVKYHVGG